MNTDSIELLILDVDGVLTDGRVMPSYDGGGPKTFSSQDGFAIKLWQRAGRQTAILSGRGGEIVTRRAEELGIKIVHNNVRDKLAVFQEILDSAGCDDAAAAYVGDDLPDLGPMARVRLPIAVANARPAVKQAAMYVTRREGGRGAVAEVVEFLLRKQGRWNRALITEV